MKYVERSNELTESFVEQAKRFDPLLTDDEIHQALRNLWVFESILDYFQVPLALTPSSFAYSLLYPYTDNWLDTPGRSVEEKTGLVRWLSQWFEEGGCDPVDEITKIVGNLLGMIGDEFPLGSNDGVYGSLRAILDAQRDSLSAQGSGSKIDDRSLRALTVRKGGTSVLADCFLAGGHPGAEACSVMFAYGVVLQLIDDLQDLEEDICAGHSTPYGRLSPGWEIEKETRKLLGFGATVAALIGRKNADLGGLIADSCNLLTLTAVCRNPERFSGDFIRFIQPSMPVRPAFLQNLKTLFVERTPHHASPSGECRAA